MKKNFFTYLLPALLLGFMSVSFVACGGDDEDNAPDIDNNSGNDNNGSTEQPTLKEIIVTVDANGKVSEGHTFVQIDENNFYVDDIKYTADKGELSVTGYNKSFFKGEAKIIDALDFQGRHLTVRSIGEKAFWECEVITSVTIPNSVTSIDGTAFRNCLYLCAQIDGIMQNIFQLHPTRRGASAKHNIS